MAEEAREAVRVVATAVAMAEEAREAVATVVAAATAAATAANQTPRPHSSARRVALCWRSTGTPRCRRHVPPGGSLLLASVACPPAGRAEEAMAAATAEATAAAVTAAATAAVRAVA